MRSVWGTSSPFPGVLSGTPQQGPVQTPPTADFPHLDDGQRHSILGNLQLEHDDEPKRGASRANSVRFDESAIHGHWGQVSRTSSDFFPVRSGSGMGSHPMIERSISHKSDGRHSSAGQSIHSIHSTRNNSLGLDTNFSPNHNSGTPVDTIAPPPGLFFLGPVPSIIRCWLDENFSNDTLLYAVVCTGSYKSYIDFHLIIHLGLQDQIIREANDVKIRLPVYLPEAVVQQKPSSHSSSPAPQLPSLTVDFAVLEQRTGSQHKQIQVFLGSDILKAHNADILLSQNSISLLGDDQSKLSVPLVRPEDEALFKNLGTKNFGALENFSTMMSHSQPIGSPGPFSSFGGSFIEPRRANNEDETGLSPMEHSQRNEEVSRAESPGSAASGVRSSDVSAIGDKRPPANDIETSEKVSAAQKDDEAQLRSVTEEHKVNASRARNGSRNEDVGLASEQPPNQDSSGGIWNSWRRESGLKGDVISDSPTTGSGYQRPGRGRGTKVLRPSKSSFSMPSRSFSASQPSNGAEPPTRLKDQSEKNVPGEVASRDPRRSVSGEVRSSSGAKTLRPTASKPRAANPIGGASAFPWLNGGQQGGTAAAND
ncbi:MAG: hypothetical protein M1837_001025 [Sclerophora amabilis]|nr:MAG: hypothetical protein M1837_001025 [Sclerophora amabilis]